MAEAEQRWRGKVGGMDTGEVEAFLATGVVMRLACLDEDGFPYVFPVWYEWSDGVFWVIARKKSKWAELLVADPRVGFTIDLTDSLEKVMGRGRAELVEEPNVGGRWVQIAERMSLRYLGPNGPSYLTPTLNQPRWLFKITPERVKTWQGVGWARKYWVDDSGGPSYEQAHGL
jgi:nitroimidazol reductase NimA-like FMN-containing flavoprotein (pyridoxamine 5'-phosphate oxidase superfamily)